MSSPPSLTELRTLPKVLLRDRLDAGVRPSTLLDLAAEAGVDLGTADPRALHRQLATGPIEELHAATGELLRTRDSIVRVARECGLDLAADGVVHAEVQVHPEHHLGAGLTLDTVLGAAFEGFHLAMAAAPIDLRIVCAAHETSEHIEDLAHLAIRWRDGGVVGFALETAYPHGHPPARAQAALALVRAAHLPITIDAGDKETAGMTVTEHGARRLGPSVPVISDIDRSDDSEPTLGPLASEVRDRRLAIEWCAGGTHPGTSTVDDLRQLHDLRFRVTVNTGERHRSGPLSEVLARVCEEGDLDLRDVEQLQLNAAKSAFLHFDERVHLIEDRIIPGALASRSLGLGRSAKVAELAPAERGRATNPGDAR